MTMIWADTLEMILGVVAEPSENLKWSHNPIIRAFGEAKKHWFVIKDKTGKIKTQNCARLVFPPVERLSKANPAAAVCQTHRAEHHPRLGARQSQPDQIFCVILTTWQPDNLTIPTWSDRCLLCHPSPPSSVSWRRRCGCNGQMQRYRQRQGWH